jgi:hypothetical protein
VNLPADVRRDIRLAAAVRAAAHILNHAVQEAVDMGLLVTAGVRLQELRERRTRTPRAMVAVAKR